MNNKELMGNIIDVGRMHHTYMERYLETTGVYHVQHHLLMYLSDHPDVAQTKIAKNFHVSTATIAVSLKKLEAGGYIVRRTNADDNRYNCVSITEKGKHVVEKSKCIFTSVDQQVLEVLSEEEKQIVGNCMKKLRAHLIELQETPVSQEELQANRKGELR